MTHTSSNYRLHGGEVNLGGLTTDTTIPSNVLALGLARVAEQLVELGDVKIEASSFEIYGYTTEEDDEPPAAIILHWVGMEKLDG